LVSWPTESSKLNCNFVDGWAGFFLYCMSVRHIDGVCLHGIAGEGFGCHNVLLCQLFFLIEGLQTGITYTPNC
jgi:hypothetical protein